MGCSMATSQEQISLDALLAGKIPPELREAPTQPCKHSRRSYDRPYHVHCLDCGVVWDDLTRSMDFNALSHGRLPLPLDSAHVAAERWWLLSGGYSIYEPGSTFPSEDVGTVKVSRILEDKAQTGMGADIFAAILDAVKWR